MEDMKRRQIPAFGHWDYCDDIPITQYFESAWQAGLVPEKFWEEEADLFKLKPAYHDNLQNHHKAKKGGRGKERKQGKEQQHRNQGTPRRMRTPKPVDEDLYKIPPELLHQKPKRRFLRSLVSGCLGLNCIR